MPSCAYVAAALGIGLAITLSLRAVPYALLKPLRQSDFIAKMGIWMPVGIMGILAVSTFLNSVQTADRLVPGLVAVTVTIGVHLAAGRRTLLSVGAGTLTFVGLLALL